VFSIEQYENKDSFHLQSRATQDSNCCNSVAAKSDSRFRAQHGTSAKISEGCQHKPGKWSAVNMDL